MSKIEQVKIPISGYTLIREKDNLTIHGSKIGWVEWNDDKTFKKLHEKPKIGLSLIIDPHRFSYSWLTTPITEIVNMSDGEIVFNTENSKYKLT